MRIGIDARMLGPGFGLARYTQQLVKQIAKMDSPHTFVLFVRNENQLKESGITSSDSVEIVIADIHWYTLAEQTKMSGIISSAQVDLMHFPHWNVPYFYDGSYIVTIHDLTMYHFPRPEATTLGPLMFWLKDRAHRMLLKRVTRRAKHIITTTEFTKQDVHKHLRVPLEKMTTVYQAPFKDESSFQQKFEIEKPYVLYVGSAYPHKNLEGLIAAWEVYQEEHGTDHQLVLVGKEDYFSKRLKVENQNTTCLILFAGFVPDGELTNLYKGASLYVFPSLYEGFGLPPLEAMQHGVPVVSSNRSCLPEVLGEAALFVDPENPSAFAEAIHKGLTDQDLRAVLKRNAQTELKRYSWERHGAQTLRIYEKFGK